MASIYHLSIIISLMSCSTTLLAQENSTFQRQYDTILPGGEKALNGTSRSTTCNFQFDKSQLKKVLNLQRVPTINIIKISVVHGKEVRHFPEMAWASEIGRTIISLVRLAEIRKPFDSPVFTGILKVGTEEVKIKLDENDTCLPPANNETTEFFDELLRELFSFTTETHFFELCRVHHGGYNPFNCCRIVSDENLAICKDYSSVVVKLTRPAVVLIFCISSMFVLPFVLEYMVTYPSHDEPKFYKTSESHMSLTSVLSMILFEGHGPVKSLFRRILFVGLSLVFFLPADLRGLPCLLIFISVWAVVFGVTPDIQMTNDKCEKKCSKISEGRRCFKTHWGKDIISCFTLSFLFVFDFKDWLEKKCLKEDEDSSETDSANSEGSELKCKFSHIPHNLECCKILFCEKQCCKASSLSEICKKLACRIFSLLYGLLGLLFIIISPALYVTCVAICLFKFTFVNLLWYFAVPHSFYCRPCSISKTIETVMKSVSFVLRLIILVNIAFLTGLILMLALFIVVGFSLNAEYFNPFVASSLALILFFWKNWKFSVEGRCLQLKTSIIEILKEKILGTADVQRIGDGSDSENNSKSLCDFLCGHDWWNFLNDKIPVYRKITNQDGSDDTEMNEPLVSVGAGTEEDIDEGSGTHDTEMNARTKKEPGIKFDEHGEIMIAKKLYDDIQREVLPLDQLLFLFFRRVIFVSVYAIALFIAMILARDSGVSESVQVIGAIVGSLIPSVLDDVFADNHAAQKDAKNVALKAKIERILTARRLENYDIFVKNSENEQGHDQEQLPNNNGGDPPQDAVEQPAGMH